MVTPSVDTSGGERATNDTSHPGDINCWATSPSKSNGMPRAHMRPLATARRARAPHTEPPLTTAGGGALTSVPAG
eukprot:9108852-Alexandrium_andersonii.AAC.1